MPNVSRMFCTAVTIGSRPAVGRMTGWRVAACRKRCQGLPRGIQWPYSSPKLECAYLMAVDSAHPTELTPPQRILMAPGPTALAPSVLQALIAPLTGHKDPFYLTVMD